MTLYHTWDKLARGSGKFCGCKDRKGCTMHFMHRREGNQAFPAMQKMEKKRVNYPVFVAFYQ